MNARFTKRVPIILGIGVVLMVAVGCGDSRRSEGPVGPIGTVAGVRALVQPPTTPPDFDRDLSSSPTVGGKAVTVGEVAQGPRLLMIGDSIFASMSSRYGGLACNVLTPQGWQVAVEAEVGRFVELGQRILEAKLSEGFDAVVFFLGTNYRDDRDEYRTILVDILDQLDDIPVVILTASEHRFEITEVNEVVIEQVGARENLWLIDWRRLSKRPGLLWKDGIHPSTDGERFLIKEIARVLGTAPGSEGGECLPSEFTADTTLENGPDFGNTTNGE